MPLQRLAPRKPRLNSIGLTVSHQPKGIGVEPECSCRRLLTGGNAGHLLLHVPPHGIPHHLSCLLNRLIPLPRLPDDAPVAHLLTLRRIHCLKLSVRRPEPQRGPVDQLSGQLLGTLAVSQPPLKIPVKRGPLLLERLHQRCRPLARLGAVHLPGPGLVTLAGSDIKENPVGGFKVVARRHRGGGGGRGGCRRRLRGRGICCLGLAGTQRHGRCRCSSRSSSSKKSPSIETVVRRLFLLAGPLFPDGLPWGRNSGRWKRVWRGRGSQFCRRNLRNSKGRGCKQADRSGFIRLRLVFAQRLLKTDLDIR